jgi:hypothetical protein
MVQTVESMQEQGGFRPPVELRPKSTTYVVVACLGGFPALFWFLGILLERKMDIEFLYIPLGMALLLLAFIKNKTVRLDKAGMTQGFSVFRTFMEYREITKVRRETRFAKGATAVVLVVYKSNSARRIIIPTSSFDRTELGQFIKVLRQMTPQARIEVDGLLSDV